MSQQSNNDTSDYDSDYSDDSDDINYEEFTYDYDENSATKYNIVLCELYNSKLH